MYIYAHMIMGIYHEYALVSWTIHNHTLKMCNNLQIDYGTPCLLIYDNERFRVIMVIYINLQADQILHDY